MNMRIFFLLLVTCSLSVHAGSPKSTARKLIEFGWDEPDTSFMRQHIQEMQDTPFDGCVFHVDYSKPAGGKGSFTWECWSQRPFSKEELAQAVSDLKATRFGRFKHNFLRFNTTPAKLDWFDDHSAIMTNALLAAQVARQGRCPGILFDIEQYDGPLFNYRRQRDVKNKSWDLYAAQARLRGAEVMNAFQQGYPGLKIFLTFGYSLPWAESQQGKRALADCDYGLLAPFLDGMVSAANWRVKLIDGHELSYGYKTPDQFAAARKTVTSDLVPIVRDPEKYRQVFSLAFGIWLDHDWRKQGWNVEEVSKNYFPPHAFEAAVRYAVEVSDEYVWIYSETPRWWSAEGKRQKLPKAYADALRNVTGNP